MSKRKAKPITQVEQPPDDDRTEEELVEAIAGDKEVAKEVAGLFQRRNDRGQVAHAV